MCKCAKQVCVTLETYFKTDRLISKSKKKILFFKSRRVYSPPLGASRIWTCGTQYTAGGEIYSW